MQSIRHLVAGICALALVAVPAATADAGGRTPQPPQPWPAESVAGSLVVTAHPRADVAALARELDADPGLAARRLGGALLAVQVERGREAAMAATLRGHPGVRAVEADRLRPLAAVPDDPLYPRQWAHRMARAEAAWSITTGSRSVRVALVDSGVRGDHPDLVANVVEQVDLSSGTPVRRGPGVDNDTCGIGHGTSVAGVLGAAGNDGLGIAGVAWQVGIVDIAVSGAAVPETCGMASDSLVLAAIHYAANHPDGPVDVVNLSFGSQQGYCPESYETAIADARARGVVVVAAAGNTGLNSANVPASCPGVIAVGAVTRSGERAFYSASNPWVDLSAPGGEELGSDADLVLTTASRGGWVGRRGTSFAAPYVSGVVALLRTLRPELTPDDIESVLQRSADFDHLPGHTPDLGWGRVRADRALVYAQRREEIPPPHPGMAFPVLRLQTPPGDGQVERVAGAFGSQPVEQAVAVSRAVFRDAGAVHAIVARDDDYADALSGSALGMGVAPLLFTAPRGPLAGGSRRELRRVLPPDATVYLLGGIEAVGAGVGDELTAMGYRVVRLAGASREETAAAVAREVVRQRRRFGLSPPEEVLLATRASWPDAVAAGQLAARFALPVLLTGAEQLHPAAAAALEQLRPRTVTVVGSAGRVSDLTALQAQDAAGAETLDRLAGATRDETAGLISQALAERAGARRVRVVVAVNLHHPQGYAHALSASALAGAFGGIYVTVAGADGAELSDAARRTLTELLQNRREDADISGVLAGGVDMVADTVEAELERWLRGEPPPPG